MDDLEKDPLVTTEVTVYKRRWYILLGIDRIHQLKIFNQISKPKLVAQCECFGVAGVCLPPVVM